MNQLIYKSHQKKFENLTLLLSFRCCYTFHGLETLFQFGFSQGNGDKHSDLDVAERFPQLKILRLKKINILIHKRPSESMSNIGSVAYRIRGVARTNSASDIKLNFRLKSVIYGACFFNIFNIYFKMGGNSF